MRLQYVSINNEYSSLKKVTYCFPQGSVLGPLLFLIYIKDLPNVPKLLSFLFAGDASTYFESEKFLKLQSKIDTELLQLSLWLKQIS